MSSTLATPPPDQGPSVDGIGIPPAKPAASSTQRTPAPPAELYPRKTVVAAEKKLLLLFGTLYAFYVLWCLGLMMILPDPSGGLRDLVSIGLLSNLTAAIVFLGIGFIALKRISAANASIALRKRSLLKVIAVLAPGLLLSAAMPFFITREPALPLDIISPTRAEGFVAPLSVTFSVERAVDILAKQGARAAKYQWDTDGDGTMNEETVVPQITAVYERPGVYAVVARVVLQDNSLRRLTRRFTIPGAVFEVNPPQPIVERPARFSIAHLLTDPQQLKDVQWNYGDGSPAETVTTPDATHTYYATGEYTVSATVTLLNQTQVPFTRIIHVTDPPPLPFPITLSTEPQNLIGPAPLGIVFRIETDEPVREIEWNFGDGKTERGADLRRVGHSFEKQGIYPVTASVRNSSGKTAELTSIVRVTETLSLPDLRLEGSPEVSGDRMQGEVPLTLNLTPRTTAPLIDFEWEVPDGGPLTVTDDTVRGTYREEGTYTISLFAQDPEGKAMRKPITIEVGAPAAAPTIVARPENGVAPLRVVFDASQSFIPSSETLAGFQWSFGDEAQSGRRGEPGPARVEHTYTLPGEYRVVLRVVMASGKEYTAERTIVVRRPSLSACLTASRLSVQAGKGIEFDSSCTAGNPASVLWDVRQDVQPEVVVAQSPARTYVHVFEEPGTYTVSLTVKDQFNNQDKKSISITVNP